MSVVAIHKQGGFHISDEYGDVMSFPDVETAKTMVALVSGVEMVNEFVFVDEFEQ